MKSKLLQGSNTPVQIIATTHAPLVLASVEPHFVEATDRLFSFELRDGTVSLEQARWAKQGDALNWLVSETFGLKQARSLEAERAIEAAEAAAARTAAAKTVAPSRGATSLATNQVPASAAPMPTTHQASDATTRAFNMKYPGHCKSTPRRAQR